MRNSLRFLLAACILVATPGAALAAAGHSWIHPGAIGRSGSGALVFASDQTKNVVNIYSASNPSQPVGQIAGLLSLPDILAVDTSNNLYVHNARTNTILVFAPPYTGTPFKRYYDGLSNFAGLVIDRGGTLYSANFYQLVEYPHGNPRAKFINLPVDPIAVTLDSRGRIISSFNGGGSAGVFRMDRGNAVPQNLLIPLQQSAADVLYDGAGNLVVEDNGGGYIGIFKPGATKPTATWTGFVAPNHLAFSADYSTLYVSDSGNQTVKAFSYPAGQLLWQLAGFTQVAGLAAAPAAIAGGTGNATAPFPAVERAALQRPIPPAAVAKNKFVSLVPRGVQRESRPTWMRAASRRHDASPDQAWVSPIDSPGLVQRYALPNQNNSAPNCATPPVTGVNSISVDASGNLWVPSYNNGPRTGTAQKYTCNAPMGNPITDYIGQPSDVAFAANGNVIIGDIVDYFPNNGNWYLESGTAGAYAPSGAFVGLLSDPTFFSPHPPGFDIFNALDGIAADASGNCYISHASNSGGGEVVEFPACKPAKRGKVLKGPHPWSAGKVTFDAAGNMLVTDFAAIYYYRQWSVSVYAPPYDKKPISSFPMYGPAVSCAFDSPQANLYCANTWNGTIDAYAYPGGTYEYSWNNGLQTWGASGIAIATGGAR